MNEFTFVFALWHWEQNINSEVSWKMRFFYFVLLGVSSVSDGVLLMEGDSVTLNSNVRKSIQEKIKWYFNDTRIAEINEDQSNICTDVQCNEGTERFRDRLELDHQTGSLTITNTTNTHSGVYNLQIINSGGITEDSFNVSVHGVSAGERDEIKRKTVKEGESVTLDPAGVRNPNDLMTWYYNGTLIAEITGDQSKICTDVQCKERFSDRLKLDKRTGSLTITNTRNTDTGEYKLLISSSKFSISRTFPEVTIIDDPVSGVSSAAAAAGISAAVVLLVAAAAGLIGWKRKGRKKRSSMPHNGHQKNGGTASFNNYTDEPSVTAGNGKSHNGIENGATVELRQNDK